MQAKDIITPEELKALLSPEELEVIMTTSDASPEREPAGPESRVLHEFRQAMYAMNKQIQLLQERVRQLELQVHVQGLGGRASLEPAAARVQREEPWPSPSLGVESAPSAAATEPLVPRSERHGKKKSGTGKLF